MTSVIIRLFDISLALVGLIITLPVLLVLVIIGWLDTGSPVFTQQRVGRHRRPFTLVKLRTMRKDTAHVASHLASRDAITPFGHFLRRSKLDELPQLWNVLKGEMSLVGPRPCLLSQQELIAERAARSVFDVRPGITGLAQINDIDMSQPERLAEIDSQMIQQQSVAQYLRLILATVAGNGQGDRVN